MPCCFVEFGSLAGRIDCSRVMLEVLDQIHLNVGSSLLEMVTAGSSGTVLEMEMASAGTVPEMVTVSAGTGGCHDLNQSGSPSCFYQTSRQCHVSGFDLCVLECSNLDKY
uniref:Uncharacterized protein n=1 Tax=Cacopsylla melanoneura TaxID=428564 RepID=A0A8D8TBM0_9HEMI